VHLSCVQTDSLGLGSWLSPARGTIPYAWEAPLNYLWMAPVMLEYFYGSATPNDLMIAAISGPGYWYPKAIPGDLLSTVLATAAELAAALDISIMETMDDSEGSTVEGNDDLTAEVATAYFDAFPNYTGFVHGYAPAFTFAHRGGAANAGRGQAMLSFDYYLSESCTEEEAANDLLELAALNAAAMQGGGVQSAGGVPGGAPAQPPYFLLVHVREFSDISRVGDILATLPSNFDVLPLDSFLALAAARPTFEEHFAEY
jgi:hypothetical protein